MMTSVDARDTRIKVLSPAECRLLDLSHPITDENIIERAIRKRMEPVVSPSDHGPKSCAMGSLTVRHVFMISLAFIAASSLPSD